MADAFAMLLDAGADAAARAHDGATPLSCCGEGPERAAIERLVEESSADGVGALYKRQQSSQKLVR